MNVLANAMGKFHPTKRYREPVRRGESVGYVENPFDPHLPVRSPGDGYVMSILQDGMRVFSNTTVCILSDTIPPPFAILAPRTLTVSPPRAPLVV